MTNEQKSVRNWMTTFGQDVSEKPTLPSKEIRLLRAKLILEEAFETVDALGFDVKSVVNYNEMDYPDYIYIRFKDLIFEPLSTDENSLRDIADGCEDLKVVTEGTLVACGLTYEPKRVSIDELEKILKEDYDNPKIALNKANCDAFFDEVMRSNWTKLWTQDEIFKMIGHPDDVCFDPTNIIGENTYQDEDGTIYKKLKMNPEISNRLWLVKNEDGKIIKSPSYSPPNLQPIIDQL